MTRILRIDGSTRPVSAGSCSRELADRIFKKQQAQRPGAEIITHDLATTRQPHSANDTIVGFYTLLGQLTDGVAAALSHRLTADRKLTELRTFARQLTENRGHVGDVALQRFLAVKNDNRPAREGLTGLATELLRIFINRLAHAELHELIKPFAETHPDKPAI